MPRLRSTIIEVGGLSIDLVTLPEDAAARLLKELEFQEAMKKGGKDRFGKPVARYHGRDLRGQKCLQKAKSMHDWMAREMLMDAVEAPYLAAQDAAIAALDERTEDEA